MAVRTSNFEIAATDADRPAPDATENLAEITHGAGRFSLWRRPSSGQFAILQLRISRGGSDQSAGLDSFFSRVIVDPDDVGDLVDGSGRLYRDRIAEGDEMVGVDWFWDRIEDDTITFAFMVDLMREAVEIHSGFPTSSSPASSTSPTASGPRSTATSRRAKSTPSS